MLALPSPSLCLCSGSMTCCWRGKWRDGLLQWSSLKPRLWLMNKGELPSHWAEIPSSHNHSLCFSNFGLHPCMCVSVSFPSRPSASLSLSFVTSRFVILQRMLLFVSCLLLSFFVVVVTFSSPFHPTFLQIFSTPAASGTKTATLSPGTSSIQPTSIRWQLSHSAWLSSRSHQSCLSKKTQKCTRNLEMNGTVSQRHWKSRIRDMKPLQT